MAFCQIVFCLLFSCLSLVLCSWHNDNPQPKMLIKPHHNDYFIFTGNNTSVDHFSVSLVTGSYLLLGARNFMYKLDINNLQLIQQITWIPQQWDKDLCVMKVCGADPSRAVQFPCIMKACQNYIKILQHYDDHYLICGTNAYKPRCRKYVEEAGTLVLDGRGTFDGRGVCPYNPDHNSTALLHDHRLYTATASDFSGLDPLIYREPLRTPQYDAAILNSPSFVGSLPHGEYVYFFFREEAVECSDCRSNAVFSRVARVCKNDEGGSRSSRNMFTSFLKSRLNCSVDLFSFDEIEDVSGLIEGVYGSHKDQLVYGVFNSPLNSSSAVCAFRLRDITNAFSGQFSEQKSPSEDWEAVPNNLVPHPRPGICPNNSQDINNEALEFIHTHPLMHNHIPPFFGSPVLTRVGLNTAFTALDVDGQVGTTRGLSYDVMFVGTSTGFLLKAVNSASATSRDEASPVIIEEIQVFSRSVAVKEVIVVKVEDGEGKVIVISNSEVKSFALFRCHLASNCEDCVALQDPYCAWAVMEGRCRGATSWTRDNKMEYLQSVSTGKHGACSGGPQEANFSLEMIIITVTAAALFL